MKPDLTDITILLDRSGSMSSIASDVVGGLESFIKEQAAAPGEANFTLIQFDTNDHQQVDYLAVPIKEVDPRIDFKPRGGTPLLDALGMAIDGTGRRLSFLTEADLPSKVVFVVFTDGYENSSHEYSGARVKEMVEHQQTKYGWQFIFLGANIDAFAAGGDVGVLRSTTASVDPQLVRSAMDMTSKKMRSYRTSGNVADLNYSVAEQASLAGDSAK